MSEVTNDIETIFVTITNAVSPTTVGVIYRPPSGDISVFNEKLENLLNSVPKENTYATGDYNINLLNKNDSKTLDFEETTMSDGFFPLISLFTHKRKNCKSSCIDNILTNESEKISYQAH